MINTVLLSKVEVKKLLAILLDESLTDVAAWNQTYAIFHSRDVERAYMHENHLVTQEYQENVNADDVRWSLFDSELGGQVDFPNRTEMIGELAIYEYLLRKAKP
jgi:hypothetical protein